MTFGDNPTDRFTIRSCKCSGKIDSPQLLGFSASTVSPETTWQFIHSTSIPACRNTREASSSAPRIVPHGTATSLCTEIVTTMGVIGPGAGDGWGSSEGQSRAKNAHRCDNLGA